MRKGRSVLGAAALIVLATVLVPLQLAFLAMDASGKKTPAERVRLVHESDALSLMWLCVSAGAGWMIFSALPTRMKPYARTLVSLAAIFCSWTFGILAPLANWPDWNRIVFRLIR
jgi:hypothetical protein